MRACGSVRTAQVSEKCFGADVEGIPAAGTNVGGVGQRDEGEQTAAQPVGSSCKSRYVSAGGGTGQSIAVQERHREAAERPTVTVIETRKLNLQESFMQPLAAPVIRSHRGRLR